MTFSLSSFSPTRVLRACLWVFGCALAVNAAAQSPTSKAPANLPSMMPPQVVTYDPALSGPQADAEEDEGVTITPDDRSTSIRSYGPGGRPSREVVNPPILPEYSVSSPAEPQSVMPDTDPVRGDAVQPPMWTLWSW